MNERILALVVLLAAVLLSIYNAIVVPYEYRAASWLTLNIGVSVLLGIGSLLVAYWLYVDYEQRQEELEYLSARISMLAEPSTVGRKNNWICPSCKTLNPNEVAVCHKCKRLKPT